MKKLPLSKAFTLLEPGPVVLVTTHDGKQSNVMTISWTLVVRSGSANLNSALSGTPGMMLG
ncbi:hypothetical protein [Staphylococcus sp. J]|uniref:hypothetical protein n=1 Tax=Staphylococcus sp. J TaxID=2502244 RepID=UPI001BB11D21|nr:hypothetical protein [Staphylococcus sp. J]